LELAAEVQQRLFPSGAPQSAAFELAGYCRPARGVGGDYYDFLAFDGGSYGVTVADVSGKGMSAAILMSTVQASLRTQAAAGRIQTRAEGSVAALVAALNLLLCRSTGPSSYVTFFYMQVDERTRQMSYVNAGHNPPLLVRAARPTQADGDETLCVKLRTGGPVIGLFENLTYEEGRLQLRSGDLVVAYTDGLTESLNIIEQEFGEGELCDLLISAAADQSADEILAEVVRRVSDWSAGAPQHDDLTLVVLKVK
jgi:sigma-B regulation protein RsbU (phosphoserine phosphatase)